MLRARRCASNADDVWRFGVFASGRQIFFSASFESEQIIARLSIF